MKLSTAASLLNDIKSEIPEAIDRVKGWLNVFYNYLISYSETNEYAGYVILAIVILAALLFGFRAFKRMRNGLGFNSISYIVLFGGTSYVAFSFYTQLFQ